jgi:hypothetical protein
MTDATARVHRRARKRGWVAGVGAGAAADEAGDQLSWHWNVRYTSRRGASSRIVGNGVRPGVVPLIGEGIAAGVPQQAGWALELLAGGGRHARSAATTTNI